MNKFNMNIIVKVSSIITICIMLLLVFIIKDDIPFRILCVGGFLVGVYLVLCSFLSKFTVYEDRLVIQLPFRSWDLHWNDIGLISAVEYRKNNYNIYISPKKETTNNYKKSILINWQFNNHKELVKEIITYCEKNKNTYIDNKVYKAIGINKLE